MVMLNKSKLPLSKVLLFNSVYRHKNANTVRFAQLIISPNSDLVE